MNQKRKDSVISALLMGFAFIWLLPLFWTLWNSLRPYSEILKRGLFSWPTRLTLENYVSAYHQMSVLRYFVNTLIILIPSVAFILFFSSMTAFVLTRYRIPFERSILALFLAGSLLPAQVIYYPVFKLYLMIGDIFGNRNMLYDNYSGVILLHIAMQTGFAVLVLHSSLRSIPQDYSEAAQVDGATVFQHYFRIMIPMLKAPLASLGVLLTILIYNDFVVSWSLLKTDRHFPITTSLTRVGAFSRVIQDQNVLAAGSLIVALPLLLIYFALRKHFNSGVSFVFTNK